MKNLVLLTLLLVSTVSVAQQAQKNLLKTFDLNGQQEVVLNLDGDVNIERWNNSTMRVQMGITYQNANVHIMKFLISKGRYNLTLNNENGLILNNPNGKQDAQINKEGDMLEETIVYTIYVPQNVSVVLSDESTATILNKEDMAAAQDK